MDYLINRNNDHKSFKFITIFLSVLFTLILVAQFVLNKKKVDDLKKSSWVFSKESGIMVKVEQATFTIEDRKTEYKHHLIMFIKHFYEFDKNTFLDHIDYAKNLMENKNFENELKKYKDASILSKIEERDIIVTTNVNYKELYFEKVNNTMILHFKFKQTLRTASGYKTVREIKGSTNFMDTGNRSLTNPHATLLVNYIITSNETLEK